jgi:hypothetical protein
MFGAKAIDKIKKHFMFKIFFFFEKRTDNELMLKNILEPGRP